MSDSLPSNEQTETNCAKVLRGEVVSVTDDRLRELQRLAGNAVRLQANFHWHWLAVANELLATRADIERLTRESEENDDNARHNHQEALRLRAALERIKRIGPLGVDTYPECYRRMRAIAEEALSGEPSAHETNDHRMPKSFPVLGAHEYGDDCPRFITWYALNEEWAHRNHRQSLDTLARRGGLSPSEIVANIEQRPYRAMPIEDAVHQIKPFTYSPSKAEEEPAQRRAYYETHDPPHCPTCGCGAPETERQIREDIKVGSTLFRAGVKLRIVLERIERGFSYHPAGDPPCGG